MKGFKIISEKDIDSCIDKLNIMVEDILFDCVDDAYSDGTIDDYDDEFESCFVTEIRRFVSQHGLKFEEIKV